MPSCRSALSFVCYPIAPSLNCQCQSNQPSICCHHVVPTAAWAAGACQHDEKAGAISREKVLRTVLCASCPSQRLAAGCGARACGSAVGAWNGRSCWPCHWLVQRATGAPPLCVLSGAFVALLPVFLPLGCGCMHGHAGCSKSSHGLTSALPAGRPTSWIVVGSSSMCHASNCVAVLHSPLACTFHSCLTENGVGTRKLP
jgi:hypothetical protein